MSMPRAVLCLVMTVMAAALALTPAAAKAPPPGVVSGAFVLPNRPLWAGEVVDLSFVWRVDWNAFGNLDGTPAWDAAPLIADPWTAPALTPPAAGENMAAIRFATRAMALRPGTVRLRPVRQTMVVKTGTLRTADYERAITEPVEAAGAAARLTVRALPLAPPGFTGAVGQFTLSSAVGKGQPMVGKAMGWSLTLAGTGNWPALRGVPPRQLSRDFDLMGEPQVKEEQGASLFERKTTETILIVPRRPGPQALGPVEMPVFDPVQGRYVVIRTPAITVDVRPAPGTPQAGIVARAPKAAPLRLPPPLRGSETVAIPMDPILWGRLIAAIPAALLCLWFALALRRAVQRDPALAARRATRQANDVLTKISDRPSDPRPLIREWQHAAAQALRLDHAAPTPASFADPQWRTLWAEADLSLYAPSPVLPADWSERARHLCRLIPAPRSNLWKFLGKALLLLLPALLVVVTPVASGPGPALPPSGQAAPSDWIARYNHALALAGQNREDAAAAEALVAWVQNPRSPETRKLAHLTINKIPTGESNKGLITRSHWQDVLAGQMSPAWWQRLSLAIMLVAGLAIAALIVAHFHVCTARRPILHIVLAVALMAEIPCILAVWIYGPLANPDAAITTRASHPRMMPIEGPGDVSPLLPARQPILVRQRFLTWRYIRVGTQYGWIRNSALTQVWR